MAETDDGCGCGPSATGSPCCSVDAVLTVDERGQMVLPKDVREKAGIGPREKLAVVTWETDGDTCCIALIKAEALTGMVKDLLGPVFGEVVDSEGSG